MTRFARARGSKSSNEKTPEEGTPWLEMKKHILQGSPNSSQKPPQSISVSKAIKKPCPTEWATLDTDTIESNFALIRQHNKKDEKSSDTKKKKKKKKLKPDQDQNILNSPQKSDNKSDMEEQKKNLNHGDNLNPERVNSYDQSSNSINSKKQKKKRVLNSSQLEEPLKKKQKVKKKNINIEETNGLGKKNKKPENGAKLTNLNDFPSSQNLHSAEGKIKNFIGGKPNLELNTKKIPPKKKKSQKTQKNNGMESIKVSLNEINNHNGQLGKRNEKLNRSYKMNDSNHKKKIDKKNFNKSYDNHSAVEEIIVNGEKIKVVKFQGFNVMLDDAERLKKLRSEMLKEGIPRLKLEAALKLERRRAEKALARLKKAVCFHCRGLGHVLSECPTLTESQNTGTGICYKCGSTEHSALACKVFKGSTFQFAECFICKEQGHIAKQCPDNPRGLYPHGGACRECGAVTHLRKDCPKVVAKKEEETMTVSLRNDQNLESLEEEIWPNNAQNRGGNLKRKSLIKF